MGRNSMEMGVQASTQAANDQDTIRQGLEMTLKMFQDVMSKFQVEALDRSGLLSDVTRVLSEHHVNILSASVSTRTDRVALSRFVFEMGDPAALDHLLAAVKRIEAVYDVYRVSQ